VTNYQRVVLKSTVTTGDPFEFREPPNGMFVDPGSLMVAVCHGIDGLLNSMIYLGVFG
jgi:hypothetical protein